MTKSEQYYQKLLKNGEVTFRSLVNVNGDYTIRKNHNGTYDITVVISDCSVHYRSFTKEGVQELIEEIGD